MGEMVRCTYECTLWGTFFFVKFTNRLTQFYPELFEGGGSPTQHQANFSKKWSSYATIIELAEGDILKIDKVVAEPLEKCLLYLAYKADKAQLESMMHNEMIKSIGR